MRKALVLIIVSIICLSVVSASAGEAEKPVVNADVLAGLKLSFAGGADQRAYLGIPSEEALSLCRIKADRLIIVVLNSFCTICQSDAPVLNAVFRAIEENPSLKGLTKLIGIAAGNTLMEVEAFQREFNVAFPLVADPEYTLDRAIPENLRTPMLITAQIIEGKELRVLKTHLGEVKDIDALLEQPLKSAMLTKAEKRAGKL